jgi:hypothetical protein
LKNDVVVPPLVFVGILIGPPRTEPIAPRRIG